MRPIFNLVLAITMVMVLLGACAQPTPIAPTKPAAAPAATSAPIAAPTAAPAVAATKPAAPAATTAPTAKPAPKIQRGGTVTLVEMRQMPSLDPHEASTSLPAHYLLFEGLMNYERDASGEWKLAPELAESWNLPNATTINLKLRQGVKFHDGSPWNAEVAKWNIDRWTTNPKYYQKVYIEPIAGVDVVDPNTINIRLKAPSASSLALLGRFTEHGGFSFMSKSSFEKLGYEKTTSTPVGTGPFEFEQWLRDDKVTLKKFAGYWRKGEDGEALPYFDRYIERTILDPAVALIELKSGNVHIFKEAEGRDVPSIQANPDLVYDKMDWGATHHFHTVISFTGSALSKDLKLRQAVQYAIDREAMAKTLGFGVGRAHYYPWWDVGMLGYDEKNPRYDFQPAKTKQLLAEAGSPNGIELVYSVIARQPELRISEIAQQMWAQVGIKVTIDSMDRLVWNDRMRGQKYDMGLYRGSAYPDPDLTKRALLSDAGSNFAGMKIPELDACMKEGNTEYDKAKRNEIYKRCQKIVYENAFLMVGYSMPMNYTYRKVLNGVRYNWTNVDLRWAWLAK